MLRVNVVVILLVVGLASPAAVAQLGFTSSWDARWQAHTSPCKLSLPLVEYGMAWFSGRGDQALNFVLQSHRDAALAPIEVQRTAPAWHPDVAMGPRSLGHLYHIPDAGMMAATRLAETMLWSLRDGYELTLKGPTRHGAMGLKLHLRALGFPPALDSFLACARSPIQVSWLSMSRTRVTFPTDEATLDEAARLRLRAVIAYVQADSTISHIYVDGHTDASGTEAGNKILSKRRADAVADLLRKALKDRVLIVRFHGPRYPVADNASDAGKARNRRTTVRLARELDTEIASGG